MKTEQFVRNFYSEKENIVKEYSSENSQSEVRKLIHSMNLTNNQYEILRRVLDTSLTDVFYTILLGLDGVASIGGNQESYQLKDEKGNELTGGEIESYAYKYFHENK